MIDISPEKVARLIHVNRERGRNVTADMLSALRSSLSCCEEERRLQREEVIKLRTEVEMLQARDAEWAQKAAAWMASPEAAARLEGYRELASKCAALEDEAERLRADAERWHWWRANVEFRSDPKMDGNHTWWHCQIRAPLHGPTIEAAIDAAREGS